MSSRPRRTKDIFAILLLASLTLGLCATRASADSYTFTALPDSGASHTAPGSTVGWGYSISNNAPMGFVFAGNFVNNAEWFNADSDANLAAQPLGFAGSASLPSAPR